MAAAKAAAAKKAAAKAKGGSQQSAVEQEEIVEFKLPPEEEKRRVVMKEKDIRLMEVIESQLNKALFYLRGICMACAGCYSFNEQYVKVYKEFKKAVCDEVLVFKYALLDISVLFLYRISEEFELYVEKTPSAFSKKLVPTAEVTQEHAQLIRALSQWFKNLEKDMGKWQDLSKDVLDQLYLDVRRVRTDEHILRVNSKIVDGKDNNFIPLLFVPRINLAAAPYVHGGSEHQFKPPLPARTVEEQCVVGTLVMTETMAPSMGQFAQLLQDLAGSLDSLREMQLELHEMGVFDEEGDESENTLFFKTTHHHTISCWQPRIKAACADIFNQKSGLMADVEEVPFDREKYAKGWLDDAVDPTGYNIKDHVYDHTKNVEVIGTVD